MEALLNVASSMLAFGIVAVPVKTAFSMGAFNKFKEASAAMRSLISLLMMDVNSDKCVTISEPPRTTLLISVL